MKNSLDTEKNRPIALASTRRNVLKQGLGLSMGTAAMGMGGLFMAEKAHAWGPWHTISFTDQQNDGLAKLVPYEWFYLKWKNSENAMTKQARLYGNAPKRGVYDKYIGFMQFDSTYENLGHYGFNFECRNFGLMDVYCDDYRGPLKEKDLMSGVIQNDQGFINFDNNVQNGKDNLLRRLQDRGTYTSPAVFEQAFANLKATGNYFPPVVEYYGREVLGFFKKTVYFRALSGISTDDVNFVEYVVASNDYWRRFCTSDPLVFKAITGNGNTWTGSAGRALGTLGGAAVSTITGIASSGVGWSSSIQRVAHYTEYNASVTVYGNVVDDSNATDISYKRKSVYYETKLEGMQATTAAVALSVGTLGAGLFLSIFYLCEYPNLRGAVNDMKTVVGIDPSIRNPFIKEGVYGNVAGVTAI